MFVQFDLLGYRHPPSAAFLPSPSFSASLVFLFTPETPPMCGCFDCCPQKAPHHLLPQLQVLVPDMLALDMVLDSEVCPVKWAGLAQEVSRPPYPHTHHQTDQLLCP